MFIKKEYQKVYQKSISKKYIKMYIKMYIKKVVANKKEKKCDLINPGSVELPSCYEYNYTTHNNLLQ